MNSLIISFYRTIFFILVLSPTLSFAQPDLENFQKEWVNDLQAGASVSDFYWEDRSLVFSKVTTSNTQGFQQLIKSEVISGILRYHHEQTFEHDQFRYITVGTLETDTDSLLLLTGWRKVEDHWKKEIDVLLTISETVTEPDDALMEKLDQEREKWVELANQHNPESHIQESYTKDATYFGNGQKSEGRSEIAERYFYMENPDYQVDLVNERMWVLSEIRVLEIGRYFTGAERTGNGGLYTILWEKQEDEKWQIEFDFNF